MKFGEGIVFWVLAAFSRYAFYWLVNYMIAGASTGNLAQALVGVVVLIIFGLSLLTLTIYFALLGFDFSPKKRRRQSK